MEVWNPCKPQEFFERSLDRSFHESTIKSVANNSRKRFTHEKVAVYIIGAALLAFCANIGLCGNPNIPGRRLSIRGKKSRRFREEVHQKHIDACPGPWRRAWSMIIETQQD
jgi:hypothetical protein